MDLRKLCTAFVLLAGAAHAQFIGYTSVQTTTNQAFTAQAANGVSTVFNNIGQAAHLLSYCPTNFIGTISMEASNDGTFGAPISLAAANYNTVTSTCKTLPAGGYYPAVRARVSNYAQGSITALYTGSASPINVTQTAINSNGPTSPVQCDQNFSQLVTPTTSQQIIAAGAVQNVWICSLTISFVNAVTGTGNFFLYYGTGTTCATGNTNLLALQINTSMPLQPFFFGGSFGAWQTVPPGQNVCIQNTEAGSLFYLSITYAQGFHNP